MHMISVLGWIFSEHAQKQPCLHALPAPQREREERERESCLHCEPDLRLTVTQLLRRDDSCLALQFFFVIHRTVSNSRFTHSHGFDAQVNFSRLDRNSTRKSIGRKSHSRQCHTLPHSLSQFSFFLFFIPTAPR